MAKIVENDQKICCSKFGETPSEPVKFQRNLGPALVEVMSA